MTDIKILIVDDEVEFASTLAERLALRGYQAISANCAEDALSSVISNSPDVVILDIQMPDLSGLELMAAIKDTKPVTEVILLTGHGAIKNGIDGVMQGAFDFLMKPVSMTTLLEKIQQAWQRGQKNAKKKLI